MFSVIIHFNSIIFVWQKMRTTRVPFCYAKSPMAIIASQKVVFFLQKKQRSTGAFCWTFCLHNYSFATTSLTSKVEDLTLWNAFCFYSCCILLWFAFCKENAVFFVCKKQSNTFCLHFGTFCKQNVRKMFSNWNVLFTKCT